MITATRPFKLAVVKEELPSDFEIYQRLRPVHKEIVGLLVLGCTPYQAARTLGLNKGTIRNRMNQVYEEFEAASGLELACRMAWMVREVVDGQMSAAA